MATSFDVAEPQSEASARPGASKTDRRTLALSLIVLSVGYFAAGKAGLLLAVGNSSVSIVWPATGIAIGALLLGGSRLWPAVFVGAFFVNLTTTWDPVSSLGIAGGNTLEGVAGAYLATRFASGKHFLDRPNSLLTFALLSGFLAASLAATVGTVSLVLTHNASLSGFPTVWRTWWLGDAIGAIEVTPLVIVFTQRISRPEDLTELPGRVEGAAVAGVTVLLALVVFARDPSSFLGGYPLVFLILPPVFWAAIRFGSFGAITTTAMVSVIAIVATVAHLGPFATLPDASALLALRIFMGSLAVTALLVAADVSRHRWMEAELYHARKQLQRLLVERTAQLDAAKSLAHVGTWTYDAATKKMVWSDEMYSILGYGEERFPVLAEDAFERLWRDDREYLRQEFRAALDSDDPLHHEFRELKLRLELPNGERRTILSRLRIAAVENGRTARVEGTVQDVTERERIQHELDRLRTQLDPTLFGGQGLSIWMIPWSRMTGSGDQRSTRRQS